MIDVTPDLAIEKSPGCDNYLKLATQDGCHEKLFFGNAASLDSDRVKKIKPVLLRNTIQALGITRALIFCRTNWDCELLKSFFDAVNLFDGNENLSSACLGGGLSNDTRRVNLQKFKNNQVRFLICTDVAARGIDLNSLDFLINVTLPDTAEEYVHRVGRGGGGATRGETGFGDFPGFRSRRVGLVRQEKGIQAVVRVAFPKSRLPVCQYKTDTFFYLS